MEQQEIIDCLECLAHKYDTAHHDYYGEAEIYMDSDEAKAVKEAIKLLQEKKSV